MTCQGRDIPEPFKYQWEQNVNLHQPRGPQTRDSYAILLQCVSIRHKLSYGVLPIIPNISVVIHETKLNKTPINYVVFQNHNENWSFLHLPENVYSSFYPLPRTQFSRRRCKHRKYTDILRSICKLSFRYNFFDALSPTWVNWPKHKPLGKRFFSPMMFHTLIKDSVRRLDLQWRVAY